MSDLFVIKSQSLAFVIIKGKIDLAHSVTHSVLNIFSVVMSHVELGNKNRNMRVVHISTL